LATAPHILLAREFATSREEIVALPQLLEGIRARCPISDDQFFNLVIAMTESVNNAIVHGNKLDPSKRVRYSLECRDDGIHCVIEDEGEGFDPSEIGDPLAPENLLRESGRGMFLIRVLMRDVHVENTGRGSRMEFLCGRE